MSLLPQTNSMPEITRKLPELEDELDYLDAIVKSESCSEDDETTLERFMNSEVTIEEEVKQEPIEAFAYGCDICNRSFAESHQLKKHMVVHKRSRSKERPFKCEICKKTYKQLQGLKLHMNTHTGKFPFKCEICGKTFNNKGHLPGHMLIHSGERPHECNVCNKKFTLLGSLKTHMMRHNGVRPMNAPYAKRDSQHRMI
ncbi:zinc finger protein 2-like [Ctenocephalides felis]|uniref:zinc finger protein 2-like n=1 Tax=Ctenocephalides felis TaxID=7515 RepID=UPI000E6E1BBC|nr:zinc finger protein 2-like [Ctenocephalides felis]